MVDRPDHDQAAHGAAVVDELRIGVGRRGEHVVVNDVSFEVAPGEILGLVGESGSGKTTVGLAMLGFTRRGACIRSGAVSIDGESVTTLSETKLESVRGCVVSYVPQDPAAALNPGLTIGRQLIEVLTAHG